MTKRKMDRQQLFNEAVEHLFKQRKALGRKKLEVAG